MTVKTLKTLDYNKLYTLTLNSLASYNEKCMYCINWCHRIVIKHLDNAGMTIIWNNDNTIYNGDNQLITLSNYTVLFAQIVCVHFSICALWKSQIGMSKVELRKLMCAKILHPISRYKRGRHGSESKIRFPISLLAFFKRNFYLMYLFF